MGAMVHHVAGLALRVVPWQLEVGQLLEEHHLCAWSPSGKQRERFTIDLGTCLAKFDDTQVCTIDGSVIRNIEGLCRQFENALGVGSIGRSIDGTGGLVGALRRRPYTHATPPIKRRFIIWHEAHILLREDPILFGRAADAIAGTAAELEFCSDDMLLIQRGVFVGRPALDVYAEDEHGQFRTWFAEHGEKPLWRVVTGQRSPRVARWRIGGEMEAPRAS